MIEITLTNGDVRHWYEDEYTEYDIKNKLFVVIKGDQWVGMYALDHIVAVEVKNENESVVCIGGT